MIHERAQGEIQEVREHGEEHPQDEELAQETVLLGLELVHTEHVLVHHVFVDPVRCPVETQAEAYDRRDLHRDRPRRADAANKAGKRYNRRWMGGSRDDAPRRGTSRDRDAEVGEGKKPSE